MGAALSRNHRKDEKNASLIINQWTGMHNTDTIADEKEIRYQGIKDITRLEYKDSLKKTVVIYYHVTDLGHQLLIKPGNKDNEGGQAGIFSKQKGFHSTYQTAKEFELIKP